MSYYFRHSYMALACTTMLMGIYMAPHRKLGPVPPPVRAVHPVEMTVATILELPLFPARIDMRPHPLWLGMRFDAPQMELQPEGHEGEPKRRRLADLMPEIAARTQVERRLGFPLGDAAHKLGGATATFTPPEHWWLLHDRGELA